MCRWPAHRCTSSSPPRSSESTDPTGWLAVGTIGCEAFVPLSCPIRIRGAGGDTNGDPRLVPTIDTGRHPPRRWPSDPTPPGSCSPHGQPCPGRAASGAELLFEFAGVLGTVVSADARRSRAPIIQRAIGDGSRLQSLRGRIGRLRPPTRPVGVQVGGASCTVTPLAESGWVALARAA